MLKKNANKREITSTMDNGILHRVIQDFNNVKKQEQNENCKYYDIVKLFSNKVKNDDYFTSVSETIQNSIEVDKKLAWSIINSRKQKKNTCVALKSGDKVLHSVSDVCNEFSKHFEDISKIPGGQNDDTLQEKLLEIRRRNNNSANRNVDRASQSSE